MDVKKFKDYLYEAFTKDFCCSLDFDNEINSISLFCFEKVGDNEDLNIHKGDLNLNNILNTTLTEKEAVLMIMNQFFEHVLQKIVDTL